MSERHEFSTWCFTHRAHCAKPDADNSMLRQIIREALPMVERVQLALTVIGYEPAALLERMRAVLDEGDR